MMQVIKEISEYDYKALQDDLNGLADYDNESNVLCEKIVEHINFKDQTEWKEITEETEISHHYEMLYAFKDPLGYDFPIIRVARIDPDMNFTIMQAGNNEQNLGNYKKLLPLYSKPLPELPKCLWPAIY